MTVVVSDTSPIRALHHLELLSLLQRLYGRIIVPPAVTQELDNPPRTFSAIHLGDFPFVEVLKPADDSLVARLRTSLDVGESEAIALALETHGAKLLIDEAAGRRIAEDHGLKAFGTIRVLLDAKRANLISEVTPLVHNLVNDLRFFITPKLLTHVRRLAGES
jgi:uncharacterized protein